MVERQGNDLYSRTFFSIPLHDEVKWCGGKGTQAVLSTSPRMGEKDVLFFPCIPIHMENTERQQRSHFSNPDHHPFQPNDVPLIPNH